MEMEKLAPRPRTFHPMTMPRPVVPRPNEAVLERAWIQGVRDLQDHKVGPHGLVEERKEPVNGLDLRMENIRVLRGRCCWAEGSWSCILTGSRCMCR